MRLRRLELDIEQLYQLAAKDAARLESELSDLKDQIDNSFDLKMFFDDASIPTGEKITIVKEVFSDWSDVFLGFIVLLIEHDAIEFLDKIIEDYRKILTKNEELGFVSVISAKPMTKDQLDEIGTKIISLETGDKKSKKMQIKNRINPSLLGGFILDFNHGKILDASLAGRLAKMKKGLIK
jgi:ATP synthase F1 delta subunit